MVFLTADSNLRPLPLVFLIKKPTAPFKIEDFNRFDTIKIFDNEVAFAPTVSLKTYGFLTSFSPVWRTTYIFISVVRLLLISKYFNLNSLLFCDKQFKKYKLSVILNLPLPV